MMLRRYGTVAAGLILSEATLGGCMTAPRPATIRALVGERILSRDNGNGTSCNATYEGASTTAQASEGSMDGAVSSELVRSQCTSATTPINNRQTFQWITLRPPSFRTP